MEIKFFLGVKKEEIKHQYILDSEIKTTFYNKKPFVGFFIDNPIKLHLLSQNIMTLEKLISPLLITFNDPLPFFIFPCEVITN